jgi:uncharacterized protein YdhG (YjbR/CyaY superfamily)
MPARKPTKSAARKSTGVFTAEERAAMRERVRESRGRRDKTDGESEVRAKIAEMRASDPAIAQRVDALIRTHAPALTPRTWYGMPAYSRDGEVVLFFQPAEKFKTRYATLGFSDEANLDDGRMWPVVYALKELTSTEEDRIVELLKKALG